MTVTTALALALVAGLVCGGLVRLALYSRTHLGLAASMLSGIVGAFIGTGLVAWLDGSDRTHPLLALAAALLGTLVVILIATAVTRRPDPTAEQLVAGGESVSVEFKSTARRNLHSGQRDDRIEQVIAKTVAGLANGNGGHLLIGVSDDGEILGLEADLPFMKQPDTDRYELWLRDYLTRTIGGAATSTLHVTFPTVSGRQICAVTVPRSARPVYVIPGKNDGPQLWVRVGNSTRQLPLDQALSYASDRWGRRGLKGTRV